MWCVAFEDAAKRMLKYLENSEDLKVERTAENAGRSRFFYDANCPTGKE